MSYGFNSVDDISRAIMHSGGMKDEKGVAMCEVNARLIYDEIKDLKQEIILLNCKLSSEKLSRAPRLWKEMKEEIAKLTKFREEVIGAMKYDDDLDDDDIIEGISGMEEDIVGECELKEQITELQDTIENLKKDNKSITSHRDRLKRAVMRQNKELKTLKPSLN